MGRGGAHVAAQVSTINPEEAKEVDLHSAYEQLCFLTGGRTDADEIISKVTSLLRCLKCGGYAHEWHYNTQCNN